jgi:tetratricopeptide (TPR) repeat protein
MNERLNPEVALLSGVLALPPAERAAFLDQACVGDARLRQEVESLLAAHEQAESFLETPPPKLAATETQVVRTLLTEKAGDSIGRYKLLQQIGEGGCGVVYMAEQEEPVRRRVALKVIKLGMDTKQVIARFEAERQALAMMDHPNIAKVLDAGATGTGRPYFVMELVRGIKITDYCDQHRLPPHQRLDLFIQVCRAVQHAHQKGIIHRDLKPSNILVTSDDGVPVPKVIDFGIAKATQGRLTDQTLFTAFEQFIGTPAYMSPEQAEMSMQDVDTRSDIYSLGVLLYELLTGKTPFDSSQLLASGLEEMRRTIREVEPVKPSTRLTQERLATVSGAAAKSEIRSPKSEIDRDLDCIVMKCLEKDRARRYETANALGCDIERHLHNEPIVARPPSKLYRFHKTVQRNKTAFAAAAVIAIVLVAGVIVSTFEAVRAARAERAQSRVRELAEGINRFLTEDLLYQATPEQSARVEKVTMEQILDRAAHKLDQNPDLAGRPELEAALRFAVGNTYVKLGVFNEAERHLRRAVDLRTGALGQNHPETLAAEEVLAWLLVDGLKRYEEGELLGRRAWQGRLQALGPENRETISSLNTYACAVMNQGKFEAAEPLLRQSVREHERVFGPDDPETLSVLNDFGGLLQKRGFLAQAEQVFRQVLERRRQAGQADKLETFGTINNLAHTLFLEGRARDSGLLLSEALLRFRPKFGAENPYTLYLQHALVRAMVEEGRLDEAETLARQTLEGRLRGPPGHEGLGRIQLYLGRVLVAKKEYAEAEGLLQKARTLFSEHYAMKPELAAQAANWLGEIQTIHQAYAQAETLLLPSMEPILSPKAEMSPAERRVALGHIVNLYEAWGKPQQAAEWRGKFEAVPAQ